MRKQTAEPGSETGRAIQLVYTDENGKLKTDPEAIGALQKLKGPVAVVSLFGKAQHGKSFVWNQLVSRSVGFEVQTLHRPCTGDIWMWVEPVKRISEDGTEYSLVLLDVEGADADSIMASRSSQIFALAILLSSVFIYGPTLGVDDITLDLSRLLEISKHDHVGEAKDNTFSGLGQFSPMFVQLMTDTNSEEGGQDVTQNNRVEGLRPQLLHGVNALVKFVSERVRPKKRGDSTIVTGPPLAAFTKSFSENVNNNVVPKISSLWLSVEELEGRKSRDIATEVYMSSLERVETPKEESMLVEAHNKAVIKALNAFGESSIGNAEVKQKYKRELWTFFAKAFEDHKRVADLEAYSRCCNAIEDMGKKLWALPSSRDANSSDMIKALETAVAEYELSINGPMKWQTLSSFLKKSLQDILVHRRGNQMDELLSENSKLKLQHRSTESTVDLLKKQLEGGEKMRKEYQKQLEGAIDDMNKLSDKFKNRIHDLESKCKSIHDEHSNLMEVLGSTRLEAAEWKRKYENGASNGRVVGVDAKAIDWKIKYENTMSEQKAVSEKIAAMEERLKQVSATEDGMRAEFSRVLNEKEKVITEKDAKLATLEQLLSSTRSELKKSELKVKECSLEAKELRLQISVLNEKCESVKSAAAKSRETETHALKQERDDLEKKHLSHMEELGKLCLRLEHAESEASSAKKLVDSLRMEAEAARDNERSLQTSLAEKSIEIDRAKSRIQELESKLDIEESEAEAMKREAEALRKNVNELQASLQDKCVEIDQAKCRIEEVEKICLKLKEAEEEVATAKELASWMKTEVESARCNEGKLQALLQEKNMEIDIANGRIVNLEKQMVELSETLEKRAKQNEEAVAEWHRIINSEKEKNMRVVNTMQRVDSFMVSDEATPVQRVKRLKVEASITSSGSVFAGETEEEDAASQESGRAMSAMTPRRCTSSTGGGGTSSSSTGMDHYSKYTMKKLRDEILKHGFGAELVGLKNARKSVLVELYERCILRK